MAPEPRRITLVTDELLGYTRTGGLGTATSHLALALGQMGHGVELLYAADPPTTALGAEWARLYEAAGVEIRMLARSDATVEPGYFARMLDVERTLAADPPDVVITQDLAAPAYTAIRVRRLGLAFERTLFVVYCHGGRRWITDMARKVRVLPGAHAVTLLEQASVELADAVVSPSAYLLNWMREQGWRVPSKAFVIPHLTRSVIGGEPQAPTATNGGRVERLAFFGRLEERKGVKPFAMALNTLGPELLTGLELEFVGAATPAWPPERVEALLSDDTRRALREVRFETDLDQPEALARLSRPGTLAVMPSLGETFSNAVYECLEHGIPFLASDAGAPTELVAPEDRDRVLFEPTPNGIAEGLRRALTNGDALRPARPAFDSATAVGRWAEVVKLRPDPRTPVVDNIAAVAPPDWILLYDEEDVPDDDLVPTLVRAQAASGADVITCGVRLEPGVERFFLGDPGGLGLLANHYGTVALMRSSLLGDEEKPEDIWPLLAGLSLEGAKIVSVPRALVTQRKPPADVLSDPTGALRVVHHFEQHLPHGLRYLARLAAGLAAMQPTAVRRRSFLRRLLRR
jgi:glycosyltransferase involved in cell wall biosynthesis